MNSQWKNRSAVFLVLCSAVFLCGLSASTLAGIETAIIQKNYRKAKTLAQELIDQKPQKVQLNQAQYYLALSDLNLGEYEKARATFEKLVKETPLTDLRDKAYLGIIDSYSLSGQFEKALTVVDEALQSDPRSDYLSLVYLKQAQVNLKLARWQEAEGQLHKLSDQFPDSPEAGVARQLLEEKQFYAVQVGAFLDRGRAERLLTELKQKGEYAYIVETVDQAKNKFYRVRVGKLTSLGEAEQLQTKLSQLGYPTRIFP